MSFGPGLDCLRSGSLVVGPSANRTAGDRTSRAKLTGPRRTDHRARSIRVERGPGYVERKIEIKRSSGGNPQSRHPLIRGRSPRPPAAASAGRPPGFGGPPRVIERDVFVERDVVVRPAPRVLVVRRRAVLSASRSWGTRARRPPPPPVFVVSRAGLRPSPAPPVIIAYPVPRW